MKRTALIFRTIYTTAEEVEKVLQQVQTVEDLEALYYCSGDIIQRIPALDAAVRKSRRDLYGGTHHNSKPVKPFYKP